MDLAKVVSQSGYPSTFCGVLVRLYNIAEEFHISRAMKMIVSILPDHAATNPLLALGFALREKEINVNLAYEALCHFSQEDASSCTDAYWATIARTRQDETGYTAEEADEWRQSTHQKFDMSLRQIFDDTKQTNDERHLWSQMAFSFLREMGFGLKAARILLERRNTSA